MRPRQLTHIYRERVNPIINYIKDRLAEPLPIDKLARLAPLRAVPLPPHLPLDRRRAAARLREALAAGEGHSAYFVRSGRTPTGFGMAQGRGIELTGILVRKH
jgi:hypothetical protein